MNEIVLKRARTEAESALIEAFDQGGRRLVGASEMRASAMSRFAATGLPNRRVEAWHYTDLRGLLRQAAPVHEPNAISLQRARECIGSAPTHAVRLVILNGVFRPDLSDVAELPEGVALTSLADALAAGDVEVLSALTGDGQGGDDAVLALNTALMQDGVVLRVAPGAQVERPIAVVNMMSGGGPHAAFVRSLVIVGDGASVRLTETTAACDPAGTQVNEALVLKVGDRCKVDCVSRVTSQAADAIALNSTLVTLGANSEFNAFYYVPQAGLARRQIFARLNGGHSSLNLGGLSLLREKQHADTTLVVDHAVPDCVSREFFRHILDGESIGVYQGKVVVRQHAQKTDGAMKSQAIILGDAASMNNKPELEIFADDVVCGHGATVGQLDDDQIFYLQTRGLSRPEAEAMLLEAFADEALELIADEKLRERFVAQTSEWLSHRGGK